MLLVLECKIHPFRCEAETSPYQGRTSFLEHLHRLLHGHGTKTLQLFGGLVSLGNISFCHNDAAERIVMETIKLHHPLRGQPYTYPCTNGHNRVKQCRCSLDGYTIMKYQTQDHLVILSIPSSQVCRVADLTCMCITDRKKRSTVGANTAARSIP